MSDVIAKRKANNRKSTGYPADGTPSDALCKPGQYDAMTRGKYYDAKNGKDRWDAHQKGGRVY